MYIHKYLFIYYIILDKGLRLILPKKQGIHKHYCKAKDYILLKECDGLRVFASVSRKVNETNEKSFKIVGVDDDNILLSLLDQIPKKSQKKKKQNPIDFDFVV